MDAMELIGIDEVIIMQVMSTMDDTDLDNSFIYTLNLLKLLMNNLLIEMVSTLKDLEYWHGEADRCESELYQAITSMNGVLFSAIKESTLIKNVWNEDIPNIKPTSGVQIFSTRLVATSLARHLSALLTSAYFLKKIQLELLNHNENIYRLKDDIKPEKILSKAMIKENLIAALKIIRKSYYRLMKDKLRFNPPTPLELHEIPANNKNNGLKKREIMEMDLGSLVKTIEADLIDNSDENYPFKILSKSLRRPSTLRRYWGRYLMAASVVTFAGVVAIRMTISGELQSILKWSLQVIQSNMLEHVVTPLQKLISEFFDTVGRREGIVSRGDLEQSTRALDRMLSDYAHAHREVANFQNLPYNNSGGSNISSSTNSSSNQGLENAIGDGGQTMEFLMRKYESELHSPIRGLLFGSLMTAMLIQILTSNELTMAATAAMPAFVVLGGMLYGLTSFLFRPSVTLAATSRQLRLALVEVERALQEVYSKPPSKSPSSSSSSSSSNRQQSLSLSLSDTRSNISHYSYRGSSASVSGDEDTLYHHGGNMMTGTDSEVAAAIATPEKGMLFYRLTVLFDTIKKSVSWLGTEPKGFRGIGLLPHFKARHEGLFAEYEALRRDLFDLAAPDFEISGDRKLSTVARMRTSYQGLVPPRL